MSRHGQLAQALVPPVDMALRSHVNFSTNQMSFFSQASYFKGIFAFGASRPAKIGDRLQRYVIGRSDLRWYARFLSFASFSNNVSQGPTSTKRLKVTVQVHTTKLP